MNEFTEKFHSASGNKYLYVRISEIKINLNGNKTSVHIIYDKRCSDEYKAERANIINEIKSLLPPDAYPEIEDRAVAANSEEVYNAIFAYLKDNNIFLMYAVTKEMISITTDGSVNVKLTLPKSLFQYLSRGGYQEKIAGHLRDSFFCPCDLLMVSKSEDTEAIKNALNVKPHKARYSYERESEGRVIVPYEREKLVGDIVEDNAAYIEDCNEPLNYAVVCGTVSDYKIREYTSKDNKLKKFATFNLTDVTGSIRCSHFPRGGEDGKLDRLYDGVFLLVSGKTEFDEYLHDGSVKLSVRRITFAKMQENFTVNNIVRLPGDDYYYVKPVKKLYAGQYSLADDEKPGDVIAPLVVFEIRTAATSGKSGVPLEIGAVKIISGRIMYTFSSLIKPDVKLPEKLVKALGINETDYIHSPSAEQVFPDFYLFTQGCDITAYPSAENFAALAAAYRKLHIPLTRTSDISVYTNNSDAFKPAVHKSMPAVAIAEAVAKKLV